MSSQHDAAESDHPGTGEDHAHDEPLSAVTDRLDGEGFDSQFQAVEDGAILCLTCRERFAAGTQRADDVQRLEGASDPADMSLVMRVVCPHCEARGVLVLRYGPEASAEEAELLVELDRVPGEAGTP